jgi:hypothetical protein
MTDAAREKLSDNEWQVRATASAVAACREVLKDAINPRASIGMLNEIEWGWIACAAIFAWIKTRAEQAVAEGKPYDETIRSMQNDPQPWDAGAISSILPMLGDISDVDWSKPVGAWSKDEIARFIWKIHLLMKAATEARDNAGVGCVSNSRERAEREHSAEHGGPLMSRDEQTSEVPF